MVKTLELDRVNDILSIECMKELNSTWFFVLRPAILPIGENRYLGLTALTLFTDTFNWSIINYELRYNAFL